MTRGVSPSRALYLALPMALTVVLRIVAFGQPRRERGQVAAAPHVRVPAVPAVAESATVAPMEVERERAGPATGQIVTVIGASWFAIALAGILWGWAGTNPAFFPSPDETVNRVAAQRVAETGRPDLSLTSDDAEDLRHPRLWVTLDGRAIPAYPPVAYYLQGGMLRVPYVGKILIAALPAAGVAAFAAGVALLGTHRRWAGLLLPLMAFPALYWMMRPWVNIATMLAFLGFGVLCWAMWRSGGRREWIVASALMVGVAAAVRPDYALFLFPAWLMCTVAQSRRGEWWTILAAFAAGVVMAVAINLVLNALTTGDALKAAYQISDARRADSARQSFPGPLRLLNYLVLPAGVPSPALVRDQFGRYWLQMGPIILLTAGQVATILMLRRARTTAAVLFGAVAVLALLFMISRMSADVFGGSDADGLLRHSVPRYWAPVYILAAIPPILLVMDASDERLWSAAAALCAVLAILGAREIYTQQPESLTDIREYQAAWAGQIDTWSPSVPANTVVYTGRLDKVLWSRWEIASLPQPYDAARLAASIDGTVASGRPVVIIEDGWGPRETDALRSALAATNLRLRDGPYVGMYRVARESVAGAARIR